MTDRAAEYREQQRIADRQGSSIGLGLIASFIIFIVMTISIWTQAGPANDVNWDGKFTVLDIYDALRWGFLSVANMALTTLGDNFWAFWEVKLYAIPIWIQMIVAVAGWIAIAAVAAIVIYYVRTAGAAVFDRFPRIFPAATLSGDVFFGGIAVILVVGFVALLITGNMR